MAVTAPCIMQGPTVPLDLLSYPMCYAGKRRPCVRFRHHISSCAWCLQAASFKDRWQRSHAEMQNLISRQNREKETLQTYAVQVRAPGRTHTQQRIQVLQTARLMCPALVCALQLHDPGSLVSCNLAAQVVPHGFTRELWLHEFEGIHAFTRCHASSCLSWCSHTAVGFTSTWHLPVWCDAACRNLQSLCWRLPTTLSQLPGLCLRMCCRRVLPSKQTPHSNTSGPCWKECRQQSGCC